MLKAIFTSNATVIPTKTVPVYEQLHHLLVCAYFHLIFSIIQRYYHLYIYVVHTINIAFLFRILQTKNIRSQANLQ